MLLISLSAAIAIMFGFAALIAWLARPTVLPNVPYTYSDTQKPAPIIARTARAADSVDPEQAAVAVALAENERLGLRPPVLASAPATVPEPELKPTKVARTPAKAKRVARVQREARPPRNSWAYSPQGMFGGFFQ
jgi:hypothetical protein